MDIRDFQGITKYKILIPALYVLSWITMFAGPSLFPVQYQIYSIVLIIYFTIKVGMMVFITFYANIKSCQSFNRLETETDQAQYENFADEDDQLNYCFVIPNYKEDIQLLEETLDCLSGHKRAKQHYIIMLAMQAHEVGSDQKAQQLKTDFKNNFRVIQYTRHQMRENEQKGKAANVSWSIEHLEPILTQNMINPDTVFITVMDADSWAPNLYIDLVEQEIRQRKEERFMNIYQPPQIFTRNNLEVPAITRVSDMVHSAAQLGYLYSFIDLHFPLSNYTLSYNLIKKIGFWDTCEDAIGQDLHTTTKAYWKTQGNIKTVPIYAPFNQVNLQTGKGYWEDVRAKFWQMERHGLGVTTLAYSLKMLFNEPFRFKNLLLVYAVGQTFLVMSLLPWAILSINYQYGILYKFEKPSPQLLSESALIYLTAFLSVVSFTHYLNYEIFKRRANKYIYKKENQSVFRMIEYLILAPVMLFVASGIAFIIAAFSTLFGNPEYMVADKKTKIQKPAS